jgi:hypothetical protein
MVAAFVALVSFYKHQDVSFSIDEMKKKGPMSPFKINPSLE